MINRAAQAPSDQIEVTQSVGHGAALDGLAQRLYEELEHLDPGADPFVPMITTTTPDSFYLKGQSTDYPTALLDFDGNERASIHLRDSDLNILQILLQQLQHKDLSSTMRRAMTDAFFKTLDRRREEWSQDLSQLSEEMAALRR